MVGIVKRNCYVGVAHRLSGFCAGENDILHGRTAQLLYALLAKYPTDGVCHIALAASVGSHDARYSIVKLEFEFVCKGFEALYFNTF